MKFALMKKLRGLLASRRGESLVEVLVSIVISGLAILMLATAIASAVNVITMNRNFTDDYFAVSNAVVMADATDEAKKGSGTVSLTWTPDVGTGVPVALEQGKSSLEVNYTVSEAVSGEPIASYEKKG